MTAPSFGYCFSAHEHHQDSRVDRQKEQIEEGHFCLAHNITSVIKYVCTTQVEGSYYKQANANYPGNHSVRQVKKVPLQQ
jgi:hypothetical protein